MTSLSRPYSLWVSIAATALTAGLVGCDGNTTSDPNQPTDPQAGSDFISDAPNGSHGRGVDDAAGDGASSSSGSGGGAAGPNADPGGGEAERAIAEADIIQVENGKLYALSQYSGLSIIDISRRDRLRLLGRYRASGVPFEMYLRDGIVYAMFSSWGQYVFDEDSRGYNWVQTSRIEALDVTHPADIQPVGSFDLPGAISDSRIVGDVLYAVSFEDGYCWDCASNPNTTITSLSVANPAAISVVDQLSYDDTDSYAYGWRRSISVNQDRMYVAGIEWDGTSEGHSTIQVIDISDPTGHLVEGASVEAVGQIENRWQMDERDGVLRVISQPGVWWTDHEPSVQTFSVVSSHDLRPLGFTELDLPRPESLRSVRFDGPRAYAITAEQTDPLFTIDLSDPAHPAQVGELELPGWVYHMEPRGDRLLALGFDNSAAEGSLNVSLFDVADLAHPALVRRVAFGGQWSGVAEDQDRIHKAFNILDDLGMILVPYSGWSYDGSEYGCGAYTSGIQLLDFTHDSLTKRGVAPARGQARRAFIHDTRLFAVSDEQVGTFSIDDRDAPARTAKLDLATVVNQTVPVGDLVARLSADWWTTSNARLDITAASDPARTEPIGELDLSSLDPDSGDNCYGWGLGGARLFAHDQNVYIVWPSYDGTQTHVAVVDVTDATAPRIVGRAELPFSSGYWYGYYGYYGSAVSAGDAVVQSGSTLVFRRFEQTYYDYETPPAPSHAWLEVVDLSNPAHPTHAATVELPEAAGYTPLQIDGTTVLTSHWVPLPEDASRARFYFDRVSVASPSSPAVRPAVNVPGSLLAFDHAASRLLTVDYRHLEEPVNNPQECYNRFGWNTSFEATDPNDYDGPGTCRGTGHTLKLVDVHDTWAALRDQSAVADSTSIQSAIIGEDRVFLLANDPTWADSNDPWWYTTKVLAVGGIHDGEIQTALSDDNQLASGTPIAASGARLVVASYYPPALGVLDATDLDHMSFESRGELSSYVYQVTVSGDTALCSLGQYGLEVVDIAP